MTFDQLKYFYEAAKFQHIGKAAQSIHISPSAISAAIGALEAELGTDLFDRVGKTIVLTQAGKNLQKEVEFLFDHFEGMKIRVSGKEAELKGRYRLGASHFLASTILTQAWSALQSENPELIGEVCAFSTSKVVEDVISGVLDFGICFSPFEHPDLIQEKIYEGQLAITVRSKHPLVKEKLSTRKGLSLLSDYPAVIHKARAGVDICENHPMFEAFGVKVNATFLFDSDLCAVEKLIHSDAWSFLPDIVIKRYSKAILKLELPDQWKSPYTIAVIMRRDRLSNVVLSKLKEAVIENLKSFGP